MLLCTDPCLKIESQVTRAADTEMRTQHSETQKGPPIAGGPFGLLRCESYSRSLRFQFSRSPSVVLEDELEEEDWLEGVL